MKDDIQAAELVAYTPPLADRLDGITFGYGDVSGRLHPLTFLEVNYARAQGAKAAKQDEALGDLTRTKWFMRFGIRSVEGLATPATFDTVNLGDGVEAQALSLSTLHEIMAGWTAEDAELLAGTCFEITFPKAIERSRLDFTSPSAGDTTAPGTAQTAPAQTTELRAG